MGAVPKIFFAVKARDYFEKCLFILILCNVVSLSGSHAQVIWAGLKAGAQLGSVNHDDRYFPDTVKFGGASVGYSAGAVISFKVKNRYFLQTEYLYTVKSKSLKGKIDPDLHDKTTYHYFEVPILFTVQFKGQIGKGREFKWFLGAGPNLSYMLGGKGVLKSGALIENRINQLDYKIKFGTRPDRNHPGIIYYTNANRLQFGINIGTGLLFEPVRRHKAILDIRYTFDQTMVGKTHADYLIPNDYHDNLRFRNHALKASIMYLLESNVSKKSRNKGKSNIKRRM